MCRLITSNNSYYPLDYRMYAPEYERLTKNDYFLANLTYIHRQNRIFYTTLKSNRLVSLSKEEGYIHLDAITWTPDQLRTGISVKLKEVPFRVMLFKVVATNGDIDWVITNDPATNLTVSIVRGRNDVRWDVECMHRELKQLTGIEKCQCQSAWAQRNDIACCYHAWLALKVHAAKLKKTLYRVQSELLSNYLIAELKQPHIRALNL